MQPYNVIHPTNIEIPIVLSVPHCGVAFPDEIKDQYDPVLAASPDDTDWFVDRLYDFGPAMGMTMIKAVYSRWVVDLNRDQDSKPLYADGRIITALCPVTNFLGEHLYQDKREKVNETEVIRRVDAYYRPYHDQLQRLLDEKKNRFGVVLLWDCHSIRASVPTIHKDKFPDLILGDADGTSASPGLIESAISSLEGGNYSFSHNYPFKGGYITRSFGQPSQDQHALQLEMTKINYMDDAEIKYDETRADRIRDILMKTLESIQEVLQH